MDHNSPMPQPMMDHVESGVSFPLENNDSMTNNWENNDSVTNNWENNDSVTNNWDATTNNQQQIQEPLTYDELFPELPNTKMKYDETNSQGISWAKNSDMRIATSVVTHIFQIPYEERAKIDENNQFGESAPSRICGEITTKTGAHMEISTAKDQSLNFLITGKNDEVMKARALAMERFQTQARHVIKVPREHHSAILGKKGKKLQDIEEMSNTKVQIPSTANASDEIVIKGTKEGIEKAVHEIRLISDELSKQAYEKLEIPKRFHPFVNPIYNDKLNQIASDHNVRINIPPQSLANDVITVIGEKEGVQMCKNMIIKIYKEMEKKCQTISIEVKKSQHKYVIGHRGANIAEFMQKLNVVVEVPPLDSLSDTIILRGPQEKLGTALSMVYEKSNSFLTEVVDCPAWINKYIIGSKKVRKQLTEDHPKVNVIMSATENGIKLEGSKEDVENAKDQLEAKIADMLARLIGEEMSVNPQHFKHIIGKSGANINRIRDDHHVVIGISESNGRHVICIQGTPSDVKSAVRELNDIVEKLENEKERELHIDHRFYGQIIGTKGEKIREIREMYNSVMIMLPKSDSVKSDVVKVRGPKEDVDECCRYLLRFTKEIAESSHQIKMSISRQQYRFIIGKSGSKIGKIREETNTRIDLPSEGDEVTITGRKGDCERARQLIQQIQNEVANVIDMEIIIPSKFHNALIGPGGKNIRSISEDCGGIIIKFPSTESKSDKVSLRGSKEDVMKAKQLLIELSNERQLSSITAEVKAKPEFHRYLIGRNGANIRKIRDKTGARIIFPNENDDVKDVITIIGKKEAVEMAKSELKSVIQELDKVSEETVSIDPKYHRHFVSRGGEVLKEIGEQFGGVRVSFPRQGDHSNNLVVIKGVQDCVAAAKERMLTIVEELKQEVVELVEIPQKHHRTLMGPRGSKVQAIQSEFDVSIKFPDKDTGSHGSDSGEAINGFDSNKSRDIIIVRGKKDKCLAAKDALFAMVPIERELTVPFKYHRFIIGQKGEYVRTLMNENDVNIKVPPAQEHSDKVLIIGPPANVNNAKEAIEKKVVELQGEEEDKLLRSFQLPLKIDPEYHSKIIGRRGAVVSKIRDKYKVNIQFPTRGSDQDDLIIITGYEHSCNDAKAAIMKITGDLDNIMKKTTRIDSRIHSRLIGAKGRAIRKIMDDYKVEIKFPRENDDPNVVMVMGKPEDVDECIDHLLNLEEEYLQDITDWEETKQYVVESASSQTAENGTSGPIQPSAADKGFVVAGAPWTQPTPDMDSSEDFPSMGSASAPSMTPAWGPRRG